MFAYCAPIMPRIGCAFLPVAIIAGCASWRFPFSRAPFAPRQGMTRQLRRMRTTRQHTAMKGQ